MPCCSGRDDIDRRDGHGDTEAQSRKREETLLTISFSLFLCGSVALWLNRRPNVVCSDLGLNIEHVVPRDDPDDPAILLDQDRWRGLLILLRARDLHVLIDDRERRVHHLSHWRLQQLPVI